MARNYVLIGDLLGLDPRFLAESMNAHKVTEISRDDAMIYHSKDSRDYRGPVFIEWISLGPDLRFDFSTYGIQCQIKAILDASTYRAIANKGRLAKSLPQWCARSWTISEFMEQVKAGHFADGATFIARPIGRGFFSGHGIRRFILSGERAAENIAKHYARIKVTDLAVSEYIGHPYLFDGKKFHLRMYLMVAVVPDRYFSWTLWGTAREDRNADALRAKIITAAQKWRTDDINNDDIHDSHMKSTAVAVFFPHDSARITKADGVTRLRDEEISRFWDQMKVMCDDIVALVRETIAPYEESRAGFTVFGLDIMMQDDHPVLLEVNDMVGYTSPDCPLWDRFRREYFEWVWNAAIAPISAHL